MLQFLKLGKINYEIVSKNIKDVFTVNNGELCSDMVDIYQEEGIILEPAGCLSISGLRKLDRDKIKNKDAFVFYQVEIMILLDIMKFLEKINT